MFFLTLALQALLASGHGEPAPLPPHRFEEVRMPAPWLLAAGPGGVINGWDPRRRLAVQWNLKGKRLRHCRVEDPRLPHQPAFLFAGRPDRLLVSYFDFPAGSEKARQLALLDLERCRVLGVLAVAGLVQSLTATPDGWLANLQEGSLLAPEHSFVALNDEGRVVDRFDLAPAVAAAAKELELPTEHAPRGGRLLAVGREVWLLPDLAYELWRPPQKGKPLRRLVPPPCLAAKARILTPEESARRSKERAQLFPEVVRQAIERQGSDGKAPPIVQRPTRGVAVYGGLVAVQLTDPRVDGGARIDVWDVGREALLAVVPVPAAAGLLAMGDGFVWLTQEGEPLRPLSLPPLEQPLAEPCAAVAAATGPAATP